MPAPAYLAACTIYRDDADYLAEWIEFHRLVGVERFFLYDNGSQDHHLDVLAPYLREGAVVRHEWPFPFLGDNGRPKAMFTAFEHCAGAHRNDARWIAFLDVDEFLFSPTGAPVPDMVRDFEEFPGVVISRAEFGPSGHATKPPGLVIESYVERIEPRPDEQAAYKSIVDPRRMARTLSAHSFRYTAGLPVDEERRPVDPLKRMTRKPVAWSRLRVHHYFTRSEEERRRKAAMWAGTGSTRRVPAAPLDLRRTVRDETLAAHAPAVREAVARAQARP
jgi:glycosyl transferase family 92